MNNKHTRNRYIFVGIDHDDADTFSFEISADNISNALLLAQKKISNDENEYELTLIIDSRMHRYNIIDGKAYLHT